MNDDFDDFPQEFDFAAAAAAASAKAVSEKEEEKGEEKEEVILLDPPPPELVAAFEARQRAKYLSTLDARLATIRSTPPEEAVLTSDVHNYGYRAYSNEREQQSASLLDDDLIIADAERRYTVAAHDDGSSACSSTTAAAAAAESQANGDDSSDDDDDDDFELPEFDPFRLHQPPPSAQPNGDQDDMYAGYAPFQNDDDDDECEESFGDFVAG
jgi:hypothetical protein